MTRHIKQLAGARAEFALADDNSIWLWTGTGWENATRPPLPQDVPEMTMTLREEIDQKKTELVRELGIKPLVIEEVEFPSVVFGMEPPAQSSQNPPAVKRGPGRPKKVQS